MKNFFYVLCITTLLVGCQTKAPHKIQDDQRLYDQGMHYFQKRSFVSAIDYFVEIKNRFPESPYYQEAKLRLADCYYKTQEFIDAEIEYHQFVTLHPLYKDIAEVWLKLGKSQYYQAPKSHEKDLTQIKAAKTTFTMVKHKWPGSSQADEAQKMIELSTNQEIEKELYLGKFYYRTKKYKVAIKKLEELSLEGSQNTQYVGERNILLAKAYIKNKQTKEAAQILKSIINNEALASYHGKSQRLLNRVDGSQTFHNGL